MIGIIKLIRPPLFIMGFVASWALLVHSGLWGNEEALYILLAVGFGNAAFTVYNEIFDVEQDRINKPWKPLPSGKVDIKTAKKIADIFMVVSVVSLFAASPHNYAYLLVGFAGYIASFAYDVLKERGIFGNFCLGLAYTCAAYLSMGLTDISFPIVFGILTVAHNILVQLQDLEADRKARVITFPQVAGEELSQLTSLVLAGISLILFIESGYYTLAVAGALVVFAAWYEEKVELLVRYGVRLVLLIGFLLMGLGVV